jgi:hypothetical protein
VACLHVSKGSTGFTIAHNLISNATIAIAGLRATCGINITDFGWASAADNVSGEVSGNRFYDLGTGTGESDGNGLQFNTTSGYNCNVRVIGNHFAKWRRSAVKLICDGAVVAGNTFDNTENAGARCAVRSYGSNNIITDNDIYGDFLNYGIEVGTTIFPVSGNVVANNTIHFTGTPSGLFPVGIFFNDNTFNSSANNNQVEDGMYHTLVYGKVVNCSFGGLVATNLAADVIKFVVNGGNAPVNCSVGSIQGAKITGQAVNAANGANINVGGPIQITDASGNMVLNPITFASGVSGKRWVRMNADPAVYAPWLDWNGDIIGSPGGLIDECLSPTSAGGAIGWTSSVSGAGARWRWGTRRTPIILECIARRRGPRRRGWRICGRAWASACWGRARLNISRA